MNVKYRCLAVALFAVSLLGIGVAAQFAPRQQEAHPIFQGLEVGQTVDIVWGGERGRDPVGQGYVIRNFGGFDKILELGPDYIAYERTARRYSIYISQIRLVEIR